MFRGRQALILIWDVSSVKLMYHMFEGASRFNSNISSWNVSSVTDMTYMFRDASSFNQNLCSWGSKAPPLLLFFIFSTGMFMALVAPTRTGLQELQDPGVLLPALE
jgi:surface protein